MLAPLVKLSTRRANRAACWLLSFVCVAAFAQQQQDSSDDSRFALLEGKVLQSVTKEPVRKAHVTLQSADEGNIAELVATTDEAGVFRFARVQPGSYHLTASKESYVEGDYGQTTPQSSSSPLKVKEGDRIIDLKLPLFPGGVISGRVMDADGDALPGNQVFLWSMMRFNGRIRRNLTGHTTTDRSGAYRFDGLSADSYYVSAVAENWENVVQQIHVDSSGKPTRLRDLVTYYPGSLTFHDAQAIKVQGGQELEGIDIQVRRGPLLSVKGKIMGTAGSFGHYRLSANAADSNAYAEEDAQIRPNGEFLFDGLPPGEHRLTLLRPSQDSTQLVGQTTVELTDTDLTNVVITPYKPAQVRVRLVVEGQEDNPFIGGSVFLHPSDWDGTLNRSNIQYKAENGIYVLDNVVPGTYWFWFSNAPNYYLKKIQSGNQILNAEAIEVGDGAVLDLLVTYSKNVASISGDVESAKDQATQSTNVILIREEALSPSQKIKEVTLDQSHHFTVNRLTPGKYLVFATQKDTDLWSNPEFVKALKSKAVELELSESQKATISLKLIPQEDTNAVKKQLGL